MKYVFFVVCFVSFLFADPSVENLFSASCPSGTTVYVICEYLNNYTIDSTYTVERDAKEVIVRAKSGIYRFERSSVISINWHEQPCVKVKKEIPKKDVPKILPKQDVKKAVVPKAIDLDEIWEVK